MKKNETFIKGHLMSCSHNLDYIYTNINNQVKMINDGKKAKEDLIILSSKLYNKFKKFVDNNRDLFEDGFMQYNNPAILNSEISDEKKSVKLWVKTDSESHIILVPFDFISDENGYTTRRRVIMTFGKNATKKDINKHYDREIYDALERVKSLELEKNAIIKDMDNSDWS